MMHSMNLLRSLIHYDLFTSGNLNEVPDGVHYMISQYCNRNLLLKGNVILQKIMYCNLTSDAGDVSL